MASRLDELMEQASMALARLDYSGCETLCLEALALARYTQDWTYYARILMPLQESRRQIRMIASDRTIRLGSTDLSGPATSWLDQLKSGCIVLTAPHQATDAMALRQVAREGQQCIEVLFADNPASSMRWTIRSFDGPDIQWQAKAPPLHWIDQWHRPDEQATPPDQRSTKDRLGSASWFLHASESLGDTALGSVEATEGCLERIEILEQMLQIVTSHEILHQRLGDAARAITPAR